MKKKINDISRLITCEVCHETYFCKATVMDAEVTEEHFILAQVDGKITTYPGRSRHLTFLDDYKDSLYTGIDCIVEVKCPRCGVFHQYADELVLGPHTDYPLF